MEVDFSQTVHQNVMKFLEHVTIIYIHILMKHVGKWIHNFQDKIKKNFYSKLGVPYSKNKVSCSILGKQGKMIEKSFEMMGGCWKWMRVMDWHDLGPSGASEKRRRKSKFYFLWLGFWPTLYFGANLFFWCLKRLEITCIH